VEKDPSFGALVPVYLEACAAEGKTQKTLRAYAKTLSLYVRMAASEGLPLRVDEVTLPDVYRYLAAVRRRGAGDATQHRRQRELKHFYSWLRRMEIVASNPFQRVPLIRLEGRWCGRTLSL